MTMVARSRKTRSLPELAAVRCDRGGLDHGVGALVGVRRSWQPEMGDQRSWAGQRVVAVASNTRTGPARRRVRASAANSSRSGLVVLHSSAPGAASTLCTRSARDFPVWVGARCRSGWSAVSTCGRSGRGAAGPRPGRAGRGRGRGRTARGGSTGRWPAPRASDSSRRISRRLACPAGVGPQRRQPSPTTGVAAAETSPSSTVATAQ